MKNTERDSRVNTSYNWEEKIKRTEKKESGEHVNVSMNNWERVIKWHWISLTFVKGGVQLAAPYKLG